MNVLFLSPWYPHRYDAMGGLFVRKHAEAVSRFCDVKVLYVFADENITDFEIVEQTTNNVHELYVYYPFAPQNRLYKIGKTMNYFRAYKKGFDLLRAKGWKPDLVHVNVLTRTGFVASLFKLWQGTPYVITEHWSRYLPEDNSYTGWLRKRITEWVVKRAEVLMPVSNGLKTAMETHNLTNNQTVIINNVVDDFFFERIKEKAQRVKKRILHISCFDEKAKNVRGLLNAIKLLSKKRSDFELVITGTGIDFELCYNHYKNLAFPQDTVRFLGEKTPEEVAYWLRNSDFSVMFSNYENVPVVISESLASGKPVIATKVGGIPEMIDETNGILVEASDENDLSEKMNFMLDNLAKYKAEEIRKGAAKFSYENVGKELFEIYKNALTKNHE